MKTIKIIVPKNPKTDKWKISIGRSTFQKSSAAAAYRFSEGKVNVFLGARIKQKIHIIVVYDLTRGLRLKTPPEWFNDITAGTKQELLYALACFLEDYLSPDKFQELNKKYYEKN